MFPRTAQARLHSLARGFPVLVLTGPRQSGKTTLARSSFPRHAYVSLEDPDVRQRVATDPRGFLASHRNGGVVLDEAQRLPALLSYLQTAVDADRRPGRFIVTGSQNLLLTEAVMQSLAGRAGYLELMPLSYTEGAAVFDKLSLDCNDWHSSYVASYLERDVRQLRRIGDLLQFQRFLRMMAARCGQLLDLNAVAHDLGVAQTTARDWLAILEATYVAFRLAPYHVNFGKRLVKTPKTSIGNEVDLLLDQGGVLQPVEFKSGATFQPAWIHSLQTWQRHAAAARQTEPLLVSAAPGNQRLQGMGVVHWRDALRALAAPAQLR